MAHKKTYPQTLLEQHRTGLPTYTQIQCRNGQNLKRRIALVNILHNQQWQVKRLSQFGEIFQKELQEMSIVTFSCQKVQNCLKTK